MRESSILVWVAGGAADIAPEHDVAPEHDGRRYDGPGEKGPGEGGTGEGGTEYDEGLLLAAVRAHHLEIRFEDRIARERPPWLSASTVAGVRDLAADARALARRNFAAFTEILAAGATNTAHIPGATDDVRRPLLAKGLAPFLLTGRDLLLKRSADLDLFSRDPAGLRDLLTDLGYAVDPKDPPQPYGRVVFHEFAKLHRGDVEVDLHSRFPVWSYPPGTADGVAPARHPGVWECPSHLRRGQLTPGALFDSEVTAAGFGGARVPVTGAEMTALVSCCHLFANYVTEFPGPYATIRLGELANLVELVGLPAFDWALFDKMTAAYGAEDAVAFALALGRRWFAPLPPAASGHASRFGAALPPRTLWFARGEGVFLVSAVESAEDLLVRTATAGDLVDHLGGVDVAADGDWYRTQSGSHGRSVARVLVHQDGGPPGFRFALRWDERGLVVTVVPEDGAPGREVDILCYFGEPVIECVAHPGGEHHAYNRLLERRLAPADLPFGPLTDEAADGNTGYRARIPWDRLPASASSLPMLLGVRRWHADGQYPRSGALVPLRIAGPR